MRLHFIAVGVLAALAGACSGGTQAAKNAELNERLGFAEPKPEAEPRRAPAAEVAARAEPSTAEKTPADPSVAQQDRVDAKKRESDAERSLADNATVKVDYGGIVITLSDSVLFAADQATLLPSSQALMQKVAKALLVTSEREMVIEGHTDSNGEENRNIELSRQRAEAIRTYLIAQGYPAGRIRAKGVGQDRPVSSNASPKGRGENRRMEITVSIRRDEEL